MCVTPAKVWVLGKIHFSTKRIDATHAKALAFWLKMPAKSAKVKVL